MGALLTSTIQFLFPPPAPPEPVRALDTVPAWVADASIASLLSPSQLNCWLDCQAKWYYRHVLNLPDVQGANLTLGRAVHAALAENFRQKIETKLDLPDTGVVALFVDAFESELPETTLSAEDNVDDLLDTGRAAIGMYMADVAPTIDPAAVELHVTGAIAGVAVQGYIDLMDVEGRIIDVKTAKKKPAGIRSDYRLQVATYSQLAPGANGIVKLDTLVKTKTLQLVEQTFAVTEADVRSTQTLYPLAQEGMRSGLYMPNRGSMLCSRKYCPFFERCEIDFGGQVHA
jgi:hypothetical protein